MERIENFLLSVIARPDLHWKWLNTLSLLEHIGSRKILRSNLRAEADETLLRHAAEEARHALFFKTMARRAGAGEGYAADRCSCAGSANRYIQSLDAAVLAAVGSGNAFACYLLTTYLIEIRAGIVYTIYQRLLTESRSAISLRGILREEEGHLAEMTKEIQRLGLAELARDLGALEEKAFARFLDRLETEVGPLPIQQPA